MLAATPALASATSPSYYLLKSAKAHCRSGYLKKTVTITVKRNHRKVKEHQLRCVRKSSSGGSGVTFPGGLPTVTVTPTIVPTAINHTYATTAGNTVSVGAPGVLSGASGHGLTAQLVSGAASGTLTLAKDGGFTYVPVAGSSGIVHFTYKASDLNSTTSTPATVTIDVSPVAQGGVYSVNSSQTLFIPISQLLAADVGSGLGASLVGSTANGALTLDSTGATYTPNNGFSGADAFTYQAVDSSGLHSNTVTVTINVGSGPPNVGPQTFSGAVGNTPLAVGGSRGSGPVVYQPSGSLLAGDSDPNGGALSVVPGTQATAHGSVTIAADGSFRYTPQTGVDAGSDSFDYQVDTSEGTSATTSATVDFSGARVWYVDNTFLGTSDGSTGAPFTSLAAAASAAISGDQIFVFTGSGTYGGGIALKAGVSLTGEGSALSAGSSTLLAAGTPPTLTNVSGAGITIVGNSTVAGVNVVNASVDGVSVSGSGDVVLRNMTISGSGHDGVNASSNASLTVTNSTISGSGSVGIADGGSGAQILIIAFDQLTGGHGTALALNGFSGDVQGVIESTTIGDGSTPGSGSSTGDGVDLADASGQFLVEADANTIGEIAHGTAFSVTESGASDVELTFGNGATGSGNTIGDLGGSSGNAFSFTGGAGTTCLHATGNTINSAGSGTFAMSLAAAAGAFSIQGLGANPVASFLGSPNNLLTGQSVAVHATGTITSAAGTCQTPSVLNITS